MGLVPPNQGRTHCPEQYSGNSGALPVEQGLGIIEKTDTLGDGMDVKKETTWKLMNEGLLRCPL